MPSRQSRSFGGRLRTETIVRSVCLICVVSVFFYGHTGAGKTHSMFGNKEKAPGFLPLTLESIFAYIYEVNLLY